MHIVVFLFFMLTLFGKFSLYPCICSVVNIWFIMFLVLQKRTTYDSSDFQIHTYTHTQNCTKVLYHSSIFADCNCDVVLFFTLFVFLICLQLKGELISESTNHLPVDLFPSSPPFSCRFFFSPLCFLCFSLSFQLNAGCCLDAIIIVIRDERN